MDPLAQLKTIHLPEQIDNYPMAYGWWILFATLLMLCVWALKKYLAHRKNCQVQQQAINAFKENNLDNEQLISLLKWATLHYFPRQQVASLTGDKLQDFLKACLPVKQQAEFSSLFKTALSKRYQRDEQLINNEELSSAVILWLKNALPPKKHSPAKMSENKLTTNNTGAN